MKALVQGVNARLPRRANRAGFGDRVEVSPRAAAVAVALSAIQIACTAVPPRDPPVAPVPPAGATTDTAGARAAGSAAIDQYAAAIKAASDRSDRESDSKVRANLAIQASNDADACLAIDARAAACQYGRAVATGLEARAHPARAVGLLGGMLQSLSNADSADPNYDKAGPSRVRALVLIRAPAWPLGPGDPEAGLAAARRAVALQPGYPPNVLTLAEAQSKTGDEKGARETYGHARDLALSQPSGPERDDWLHDADDGLTPKQR